jgi:Flp pilus assembly protein TadD
MLDATAVEIIPEPADLKRYEEAARVLEQATRGSGADAGVLYLLFLAYKKQGKIVEARNTLRKISKPDANVWLQMALLSLKENQLPQAEGELERAWSMEVTYEICYNLLLVRLTLGKLEGCLELLPKAISLVEQLGATDDRHFLQLLGALLKTAKRADGRIDPLLTEMSAKEEQRLLDVIRSLGQLDTVYSLLRVLADSRQRSSHVREAYIEAVLVKGKELIDRCHWTDAILLLEPLARERGFSRHNLTALLNLLGCCAAMTQDFEAAGAHFENAIKMMPNDARLHQNAALNHEFQGHLNQADPYWNRYFDLLPEQLKGPRDVNRYAEKLGYEGLLRLAGKYSDKEKWNNAISYLQRASQLRPEDSDAMERLFHLYNQAKRNGDARRTLEQLRKLRPSEPQYELYELDLIEVKGLNDIEKLLSEIDRIRKRYPGDARVDERAVGMVGNVIPLMGNLCDQLTDQMSKVIDQIKSLPNYQINWAAVRDVMRDLMKEFQKLRRITGKCLPLISSEEQKNLIRDLIDHIDKKMDACKSMGG